MEHGETLCCVDLQVAGRVGEGGCGLTAVAGGWSHSQLPAVGETGWDLGVCDTFDTFDMLSREKRRSARQNFQISGSCENFQTPGAVGKIALWVALSQKQPVKTCHPVLGSYTCTTPATAGALTAPLATARFDCTPGTCARGQQLAPNPREHPVPLYNKPMQIPGSGWRGNLVVFFGLQPETIGSPKEVRPPHTHTPASIYTQNSHNDVEA